MLNMSSSFLADVGIRAVDAGLPAARPKVSAQPLESGRIWVARHGERADAADATWEQTAERPFDALKDDFQFALTRLHARAAA